MLSRVISSGSLLMPRRLVSTVATTRPLISSFQYSDSVKAALAQGKPVVALESTIISHGMPFPANLQTAVEVENIVRDNGATPATIAILEGKVHIGLSSAQIETLAKLGREATKSSRRDLAMVMAKGLSGATTVSATMLLAHRAGISVFATGGVGGVHRDYATSLDASADLTELGRTPVAVVCAGVKSILDIGRTLEFLETQGVTVATYTTEESEKGSKDFPAFYTRKSGFKSMVSVASAEEAAKLIMANHELHLQSGMIFAVPIPKEYAMDEQVVGDAIEKAVKESVELGIVGKESTPFLLKRVNELTGGHSLKSNIQLIKQNAKVAAKIASSFVSLQTHTLSSSHSASMGGHRAGTQHRKSYSTLSRQGRPIMVVGGIAVDITSTCDPLPSGSTHTGAGFSMLHSSHVGTTRLSLGGVGRNLADVIHQLTGNCVFVSAIGGNSNQDANHESDALGLWARKELLRMGLFSDVVNNDNHNSKADTIVKIPNARTATYTAIHGPDGNLVSAIADMKVMEQLSGKAIIEMIDRFGPSSICLDGNLSAESIGEVLQHIASEKQLPAHRTNVYFEPTSVPKSIKILQPLVWAKHQNKSADTTTSTEDLPVVAFPNEFELDAMARYVKAHKSNENQEPLMILDIILESTSNNIDQNSRLVQTALENAIPVLEYIPTLFVKLGVEGCLVIQKTPGSTEPSLSSTESAKPKTGTGVRWKVFPAFKVDPTEIKSVTGAGDSFVASVVASLDFWSELASISSGWDSEKGIFGDVFWNRDLEKVIENAQIAAGCTLRSHLSTSQELKHTAQAVAQRRRLSRTKKH